MHAQKDRDIGEAIKCHHLVRISSCRPGYKVYSCMWGIIFGRDKNKSFIRRSVISGPRLYSPLVSPSRGIWHFQAAHCTIMDGCMARKNIFCNLTMLSQPHSTDAQSISGKRDKVNQVEFADVFSVHSPSEVCAARVLSKPI